MNTLEKKKREYIQTKSFLDLYDPELGKTLEFDAKQEKPDILVETIGIEVTEYLDSAVKAYVGLKNKINQKISDSLKESSISGVVASLHYPASFSISNTQADRLAESFAQFISRNLKDDRSQFYDIEIEDTIFPYVQYTKVPNSEKITISSPGAAWESTINVNELNAKIERKEYKLKSYEQRCTEFWLLIVVDGYDESSIIDIGNISNENIRTTTYNRIFLFDHFHRTYRVLKE